MLIPQCQCVLTATTTSECTSGLSPVAGGGGCRTAFAIPTQSDPSVAACADRGGARNLLYACASRIQH